MASIRCKNKHFSDTENRLTIKIIQSKLTIVENIKVCILS